MIDYESFIIEKQRLDEIINKKKKEITNLKETIKVLENFIKEEAKELEKKKEEILIQMQKNKIKKDVFGKTIFKTRKKPADKDTIIAYFEKNKDFLESPMVTKVTEKTEFDLKKAKEILSKDVIESLSSVSLNIEEL